MEQKMKTFVEDWQEKFMQEYLQPTLDVQYDKIRNSLNRKLQRHDQMHQRPQSQVLPIGQQNYFTTAGSDDAGCKDDFNDDASDRPTSIKAAPRKVLYEGQDDGSEIGTGGFQK